MIDIWLVEVAVSVFLAVVPVLVFEVVMVLLLGDGEVVVLTNNTFIRDPYSPVKGYCILHTPESITTCPGPFLMISSNESGRSKRDLRCIKRGYIRPFSLFGFMPVRP